jgi:hypothetical protein
MQIENTIENLLERNSYLKSKTLYFTYYFLYILSNKFSILLINFFNIILCERKGEKERERVKKGKK